VINIKVQNN